MTHILAPSLESIYGPAIDHQMARYTQAIDQFIARYGPGPVSIFRAPGRVNLIGEHTDYNHGYVMPAALDRDILLLARQRTDSTVRLTNGESHFDPVEFSIGPKVPIGEPGHWGNYARGAAQVLAQALACEGRSAPAGFDGFVMGAAPHGVPQGAGLSSSSALTVVTAVALAHFARWQPDPVALVQICSDAEWYVGTRGGIMDQFVSLLAARDHGLFLDCRPNGDGSYHLETIPLPAEYRLLVVNSGVHHTNTRGEFNRRVAACRAGVGLLRREFPRITHLRDVQEVDWCDLEPVLPEGTNAGELHAAGVDLGDIPGLAADDPLRVRACCRHVWQENGRVLAAVDAMHAGDVGTLGALLYAAHDSARDDYRISCPELEVLVDAARGVEGVAGARLTGAGWGGCIIALVHRDAVGEFETEVARRYRTETGRKADIFACQTAPGAGLVTVVGA